jgi:hypothetical protein
MIGVEGIVGGTMTGALYEDVENFFGDIFAWYGRYVARVPWLFVIIPLLVCGLLGLGLFGITYETDIEVLYTPIGSQSAKDRDELNALFPDATGERFYARQQITRPTYAEVIIIANTRQHGTQNNNYGACANSILSPAIIKEIQRLNDVILNITITDPDDMDSYTYREVCAKREERCVVEGLDIIKVKHPSTLIWSYRGDPHHTTPLAYGHTPKSKGMCAALNQNMIRCRPFEVGLAILGSCIVL